MFMTDRKNDQVKLEKIKLCFTRFACQFSSRFVKNFIWMQEMSVSMILVVIAEINTIIKDCLAKKMILREAVCKWKISNKNTYWEDSFKFLMYFKLFSLGCYLMWIWLALLGQSRTHWAHLCSWMALVRNRRQGGAWRCPRMACARHQPTELVMPSLVAEVVPLTEPRLRAVSVSTLLKIQNYRYQYWADTAFTVGEHTSA